MPKTCSDGVKRRLYWRASAIALIATAGLAGAANAEDTSGFWLQFAGGYNFDSGGGLNSLPAGSLAGPQGITPRNDWDVDAKIGYQAHGSPWSFDVGVKYGRTFGRNANFSGSIPTDFGYYNETTHASTNVTHTVVDFEVGRDVGMGTLPTTVGLGVRYARFDATTTGNFSTYHSTADGAFFSSAGAFKVSRISNLVGPRVFVRSRIPLNANGSWAVGWGGGAAVLFGSTSVNANGRWNDGEPAFNYYRSESVTVPNVGAYLSVNYHAPGTPATIALGYRVDAYFGAMDGGIEHERTVDIIEHGPFLGMIWKIP